MAVAKPESYFQGLFAIAAKSKATHEYGRLQVMIRKAIRDDVADQKYLRNSLGYDTELPSCKEGKSKIEFFDSVYNGCLAEIRKSATNGTAARVWKLKIDGLSGISSYIAAYANMCERGSETQKISISKDDVKKFQAMGVVVTKKKAVYSGTVTIDQLLDRLSKKLGKPEIVDLHDEFAEVYNKALDLLHMPVREPRMSAAFGVEDDFDYGSIFNQIQLGDDDADDADDHTDEIVTELAAESAEVESTETVMA